MTDFSKKWIISTLITFLAGFAMAILPQLDDITVQSLQNGAVVGAVLAGVRAGVKAVLEAFIAWYSTNQ